MTGDTPGLQSATTRADSLPPRRPLLRRVLAYALLFIVALVAYDLQPWRFRYAGYAETTLSVAGGTLRLDLSDHGRRKPRSYCLNSSFKIAGPGNEPIAIEMVRIGTRDVPSLRTGVKSEGQTRGDLNGATPMAYFQPSVVGRLVFPAEQPLEVEGAVIFRGQRHPFRVDLQLRRWHKDLKVIVFCVG